MTARRRVELTRLYLSLAAIFGAAMVWGAFGNLHPVLGPAVATIVSLAVLWWWRHVFFAERVILWLEERAPELRYALASAIERPDSPFAPVFESRVASARYGRLLATAGLRLIGIPALLLLAMQLLVRPALARSGLTDLPLPIGRGAARVAATDPERGFAVIVRVPAYAGGAIDTIPEPSSVAALVGSQVRFVGRWRSSIIMPERPTVVRLNGAAGERLVALEPRADSAPRVVLELPARDSVIAVPRGMLRLVANARDDIGLVSGQFEIIVSAGSGESFKFRSVAIGRVTMQGARSRQWEARLDLDSLALQPGNIVHLRAVARDANPSPDAESGSSETRTLRVPRPDESDSTTLDLVPPPEVGKSELSQRMLIILTERLVGQMKKLSSAKVVDESNNIAREQARLRKRVGQIVFSRLSGEEDEHEVDEVMADTISPGEALLRAASAATNVDTGHMEEGPDSPVIAINRPLLLAFNEMWSAERRLGVAEPREALPHMRAALDAIQAARAAERLYLRGKAPRVVLDLARIRLSGKREGIDPTARRPRASAITAALQRQARFSHALRLLDTATAAAIDSLLLIRVDALSEQPRLAVTLQRAIDDLRAGRDATASLRAVRAQLAGEPVAGGDRRWSGW
jgi:hypothetical protein